VTNYKQQESLEFVRITNVVKEIAFLFEKGVMKKLIVKAKVKLVLSQTRNPNPRVPYFVYLVLILIISVACNPVAKNEADVRENGIEFSIDTVFVEPERSSQIGSFYLKGDAVFYVDQAYGVIEEFTVEGESVGIRKRELDGPEELQGISELIPGKAGFVIRHGWSLFQYDSNWEFVNKSVLQFVYTVSYDEMMDNPKGEYIGMYELMNYNAKTVELPDGHLVTKVDVEHPMFNAFISRSYYKEGRILGKINPISGEVMEVFGTRPESYEQYGFVPFHARMDYHYATNGLIYVTHEIDPTIYVYDQNWELKDSFGTGGVGMKMEYKETQTLDVAFESSYFSHSRKNEAYYKDIYVDEEVELVFRTYRQGSDTADLLDETFNPLRLQIYHQKVLIEDVSVPGRFRILGKIGKKYIADGLFDEQNEKQGFYLLNLN